MRSYRLTVVLAALAVAGCLASPARAEERANVPGKYQWRTSDLYPSEAAWLKAKDDLTARIPGLAAFQGRLGESVEVFYTALSSRMDVDRALYQLRIYATLRKDEDARLGRPNELFQMASQLAVDYSSTVSYMQPEILALGAGQVRGFVTQDSRLEPYRPWLEDILRYAPHTLSAAEEKIASQAGIMANAPSQTYDMFKSADMPYPEVTLSTGETVRLDDAAYTQYRPGGHPKSPTCGHPKLLHLS